MSRKLLYHYCFSSDLDARVFQFDHAQCCTMLHTMRMKKPERIYAVSSSSRMVPFCVPPQAYRRVRHAPCTGHGVLRLDLSTAVLSSE